MDYKQLMQVMKKTRAIVKGSEDIGLLVTGQNPLELNDMDLVSWIQNAGIVDLDEVFDSFGMDITHGSLAAMAYALSEGLQSQSHDQASAMSCDPPAAAPTFIGQAQPQAYALPGGSKHLAVDPQFVQSIAEAVKASLVQDGLLKTSGIETPKVPVTSAATTSRTTTEHTAPVADIVTPVAAGGHSDLGSLVYGRSEYSEDVRLPENIIQRIFNGLPAEISKILQSATIKDKEDIGTSSFGDINFTLHKQKVETFNISNAPIKIDNVKGSENYTLTIPRIDFKLHGEFKFNTNLLLFNGPKGRGSYDVVARNWSLKMTFKFEAATDRSLSLNLLECFCNEDELELVNLDCSKPQIMSMFSKTPTRYAGKQMKQKLEETSQSVVYKTAKEVLQKVTFKGTRDELTMQRVYPGMNEECILKVCRMTLTNADMRGPLMSIDPNVAQLLPNEVVSSLSRQQIRKTDNHNPSVQAQGIFIDELTNSFAPTKMMRLLTVLDQVNPTLSKKIDEAHKMDIRQHEKTCERCSQK